MPPAAAAGALAGGGAALGIGAGALGYATGAGKSKFTPKGYGASPDYDPNRFEYGGRPGGADEAANRYGARGRYYEDTTAGMLGDAYGHRANAGVARGQQDALAKMMEERAAGRNLVSTQIANRNRNRAAKDIASKTASARGVAGLAMANQTGADATSAAAGDITEQELIASMEEQKQAEGTAFGARTGMRQQDVDTSGQLLGAGAAYGNLGLGYAGAEQGVRKTQADLNAEQQREMSGSYGQGQAIEAGIQDKNAGQDLEYIKMGLGGASGGAQAGSQAYAAGQPPAGGKPPTSDPKAKTQVKKLGEGGSFRQAMSRADEEIVDPKERVLRDPVAFERDTPAMQRNVGQQYREAEAARMKREADDIINSMSGSLASSPSVAAPEEGAPPEWLAQYMVRQEGEEALPTIEIDDEPRIAMSDPLSKFNFMSTGGAGSGPAASSIEVLGAGGGMDVNASLAAHGNIGTQFAGNPGMGPISDPSAKYGMAPMSDPKAKAEAFQLGVQHGREQYDTEIRAGAADVAAKTRQTTMNAGNSDAMRARERIPSSSRPESERRAPEFQRGDPEKEKQLQSLKMERGVDETKYLPAYYSGDPEDLRSVMTPRASPTPTASTQQGIIPRGRPIQLADYAPKTEGELRGYPPMSDPRAKALGGVHDNEVAETLDETPGYTYKFKDPGFEPDAQRPGEQRPGFLTTDLKKTPLGASVVEERPDGFEGYNQHRLDGLQHVEIRNLHERLRELEAMIATKEDRRGRQG